ncbi:MAG: FAD-dependent oxidoreductase [Rhodobacteraceae bacterium]|nr:FAD-dependent oxidoreductase [Paracoccaceae bacterium]
MERITCDLCVIGAGSGGLSVAAGAAQMGADVVLLEGAEMGGDCLNTGCVPSKALLAAAKRAPAGGGGPEVYMAAQDHVAATIAAIAPHDGQERFEGLGVRVIRAYGRFVSAQEVTVGGYRIAARRFVIATGSAPLVPPIPGLDQVPYLTNESLFDLRDRPAHLIVIGGGPIGLEMAQAHWRLGCRVTVIEAATALGRDDPELAAIVVDKLRGEGIDILERTAVEHVSGQDGEITVQIPGGTISGSHLLVAAGRKINLERLDLDRAGIAHDRSGVSVDARLRTSNRRVFAIGDAAGGLQFTHVAGYHAGIVVRQALFGLPAKARTDHIPWVTYTDPELAQIGLTEAQARTRYGARLEVVRAAMAGNDRAVTDGKTAGLIKVMVVRGRPVGVSIAGAQAGELIALWALVMANKLKMTAIANMVAPYPTLGEASKRAAGNYFSPRLFENPTVKRVVRAVQRILP